MFHPILILKLTFLVLLTACSVIDTGSRSIQPTARAATITERFENKLAETLLHLAFQDISNADASEKLIVIDSHRHKLKQSLDETKLSAGSRLQLRLLEYLRQSERNRAGASVALSYEEMLRRETSYSPNLADFENEAYARLSTAHARIRKLAQPDNQLPIETLFRAMREDHENYLPNTDAGRQEYLNLIVTSLLAIGKLTPSLVDPALIGAGIDSSEIGSTEFTVEGVENDPGRTFSYRANNKVFSIDLGDMSQLPLFETESVATYYGMPGMYAMSSRPLLKIQSMISIPRYSEGWAVYLTANLADLPDFQRSALSLLYFEAMTISLAIADMHIHTDNWSETKALEFASASSPYPVKRLQKSIQITRKMPGTFSAPLLVRMRLEELREQSKQILKQNFDLNEFHNTVLKPGPLPFIELERLVKDWINRKMMPDHPERKRLNQLQL